MGLSNKIKLRKWSYAKSLEARNNQFNNSLPNSKFKMLRVHIKYKIRARLYLHHNFTALFKSFKRCI